MERNDLDAFNTNHAGPDSPGVEPGASSRFPHSGATE